MLARDTKIYKDIENLLDLIINITDVFPKLLKYTIGEISINSCVELLTCVLMLNKSNYEERMNWFNEFEVYMDRMSSLMKIGIDKNIRKVGVKRIAAYTELVNGIGKQFSGWKKSTERQISVN